MTDEQIQKVYDDLAIYEKGILDYNNNLINSFGKTAKKHFKDLLEYCNVTDKITLVDKPNGDKQNECYGMFQDIHVDQWTVGTEGDSYAGFIYANAKGQWIKIPYSC
jgi:hypothetical protein